MVVTRSISKRFGGLAECYVPPTPRCTPPVIDLTLSSDDDEEVWQGVVFNEAPRGAVVQKRLAIRLFSRIRGALVWAFWAVCARMTRRVQATHGEANESDPANAMSLMKNTVSHTRSAVKGDVGCQMTVEGGQSVLVVVAVSVVATLVVLAVFIGLARRHYSQRHRDLKTMRQTAMAKVYPSAMPMSAKQIEQISKIVSGEPCFKA